jgi:Spy/CpxP family protein refolding chaperone
VNSGLVHRGLAVGAAALVLSGVSAGVVLTENAQGGLPAALAQNAPPSGAPPNGAPGGPQHGRGGRMGPILQSLGLSDAQKQQIRTIMRDTREKNQNLTDRDQRRANMRAAFDQIRNKVLTPSQREQFDQKMQAMRQQQGAGQAGGPGR